MIHLWNFFFLMFIFENERERDRVRMGRGWEDRIRSRLQALSCQHRAWHGAWTHGLWDHDLSWSETLNRLSHPGAPGTGLFFFKATTEELSRRSLERGLHPRPPPAPVGFVCKLVTNPSSLPMGEGAVPRANVCQVCINKLWTILAALWFAIAFCSLGNVFRLEAPAVLSITCESEYVSTCPLGVGK